jgi:hypothetical protein
MYYEEEYQDEYEEDYDIFEDPFGKSALRKETSDNPRVHSCPTCKQENRLTYKDVMLGYQCDECADNLENFGY